MEAYKLLGEAQVTGENIEKFVKQSKTHQSSDQDTGYIDEIDDSSRK